MSETNLPPLPPDIEELLRSAPRPVPPAGFNDRVLERIHDTLGPFTGPTGGGEGAPPPPAAATATAIAAKMGTWGIPVSVAALVMGGAAGVVVGPKLRPPPEPAPIVQREEPPAPPVITPAPEPVDTAPAIKSEPPPKPRTQVKDPPAPKVSRDVALSEERALVELARTALSRRDPTQAFSAIDQHAARFPKGQLVEERESLRVQALASTGRLEEAKSKAAEFRRRFPESMLLPAVEAALSAEP
jgi:hypothetical protein